MGLTQKLDQLMNEKVMNRLELSKQSGIPYTTIINFYEKGTENVKLSTLRKLAEYFDCGIDYLVGDSNESEIEEDNPPTVENETFIKEYLEAPRQLQQELLYLWSVLKDAEKGRQLKNE